MVDEGRAHRPSQDINRRHEPGACLDSPVRLATVSVAALPPSHERRAKDHDPEPAPRVHLRGGVPPDSGHPGPIEPAGCPGQEPRATSRVPRGVPISRRFAWRLRLPGGITDWSGSGDIYVTQ